MVHIATNSRSIKECLKRGNSQILVQVVDKITSFQINFLSAMSTSKRKSSVSMGMNMNVSTSARTIHKAKREQKKTAPIRVASAGRLELTDGATVSYTPQFLDATEAEACYRRMLNEVRWSQPELTIMGRKILTPRLTSYQADDQRFSYAYSGVKNIPDPFHPLVLDIKVSMAFAYAHRAIVRTASRCIHHHVMVIVYWHSCCRIE